MQIAAGEQMISRGFPPRKVFDEGFAFVLLEASFEFRKMPFEGDIIRLGTQTRIPKGVRSVREYEVQNEDGEVIIPILTTWGLINPITRVLLRPKMFPYDFGNCPPSFEDVVMPKHDKDAQYEKVYEFTVTPSMLDVYGHVNNAKYADFAMDALEDPLRLPKTSMIRYRKEVRQGQTIEVTRLTTDEACFIKGIIAQTGETSFESIYTYEDK
jgi:acyl-CoA thioesterase FadM